MEFHYNLTGFSVDNFRVFGKETKFNVAPITMLTGTNSSGKSSFTKALHLLHLSYKKNGLRKLDLMDSNLKIGGYESIINTFRKCNEISFSLEVETKNILSKHLRKYKIHLIYNNNYLKSLKVFDEIELLLEREFDISTYGEVVVKKSYIKLPDKIINKKALSDLFNGLPEKDFKLICDSVFHFLQNNLASHTFKDPYEHLNSFDATGEDFLSEQYYKIIEGLKYIGEIHSEHIQGYDAETSTEIDYWCDHIYSANPKLKEILPTFILEITDNSIQEQYLHNYLSLKQIDDTELLPTDLLKNIFERLIFIDGVRATQEIVYTKENSPGFYDILENFTDSLHPDWKFIEKWVVEKFKLIKVDNGSKFDDIFKIRQIPGYGYILQVFKGNTNIGLAGLGYGVSQLLPIILKVSLNSHAIFVIEEPESNLHPALQSTLASFFVETVKRSDGFSQPRQYIIETHSEYIIRKLQYLTATGDITTDDSQLYYFNDHDTLSPLEDQVKSININKNGSLTDGFGSGFFDEADNIALELFLLNQSKNN